jgi:hypothetical protein
VTRGAGGASLVMDVALLAGKTTMAADENK